MSTYDPIKALERVNKEIIEWKELPEYVLAQRILRFKKAFPFGMYALIKEILQKRKRLKLSNAISKYVKPEEREYACPEKVLDKKGVVYTCITKGYDEPMEPILLSKELDYVLFTDIEKSNDTSVWQYRKVQDMSASSLGTLTNRYYKFHPFDLFEDKDYAIYIDGNVKIISDVTGLYNVAHESKTGIAIHQHACRDCAYMDAQWCIVNGRGNRVAIEAQMKRYEREGFPRNYGLRENTIIVVDLHNPLAKMIMDAWWDEYIDTKTGRDQVALPYVMWKLGLTMDEIGSLGNDEYFNPKFRIDAHSRQIKHGMNSLI